MPELPEVEVTRRYIAPRLSGRRVAEVVTSAPSYFFLTHPKELKRRLLGRTLGELARHGKYLVLGLDDDSRLLLHLGMTGQLFTQSAKSVRLLTSTRGATLTPEALARFEPDSHTHLVLRFEDGDEDVLFRDVRKFGKVRWLGAGESDARLDKLGPDALAVTGKLLFERLSLRATAVKNVLLDQGVIAGVGNIYADEALFRAKVAPTRSARDVSRKECDKLARALRSVLNRSIETGGSSISDYVRPDGSDGGYQDERKVYARSGQPCLACGTPITRIVIGQRSTHFCGRCQR